MKRITGPAARAGLLLVAACLMLGGCKTNSKPSEGEQSSGFLNPFEDRPFSEGETVLPAPPQDADLIPFSVNDSGNFDFAVDAKSVSVGADNVVRYTVVITSKSGARNVSYEGMRCDAFERKVYATMPTGSKDWVSNRGMDDWQRMMTRQRNSYASTLATDYFCDGRTVAGKPEKLIRDLRAYAPTFRRSP